MTVGVAVITYKRPQHVADCLAAIRDHTSGQYSLAVSCDDDNDRASKAYAKQYGARYLSGPNRGVVWSKNRALYYFMSRTRCDPIILIEDDALPAQDDWLSLWVEATARWDHVNLSFPALLDATRHDRTGRGTPADPYLTKMITGQCTSTSRRAIELAGYIDPRFSGYGYGHAEWSIRTGKILWGLPPGSPYVYRSIDGGIELVGSISFKNDAEMQRNAGVLQAIQKETPTYRQPWLNNGERELLQRQVTTGPWSVLIRLANGTFISQFAD